MTLKKSPQYLQLKEAMDIIEEMKVPEHLQQQALTHLLAGHSDNASEAAEKPTPTQPVAHGLRDFIKATQPKGAVQEIPSLLYWAKTNEDKDVFSEREVIELYRRANIRPPKNVAQSLRDLSSKKYMRLEAAKGQPGYVRLSRIGEDVVLHELLRSEE